MNYINLLFLIVGFAVSFVISKGNLCFLGIHSWENTNVLVGKDGDFKMSLYRRICKKCNRLGMYME